MRVLNIKRNFARTENQKIAAGMNDMSNQYADKYADAKIFCTYKIKCANKRKLYLRLKTLRRLKI